MDVATAASRPVACADHPDRPAHARCMSCRKVLCDECATPWDGINYCSRCLRERARTGGDSAAWATALLLGVAVAGLALAHAHVMTWMGGVFARLF